MNSGYLYANQFCRNFSSGTYSFYSEGGNDINFKQVAHQCTVYTMISISFSLGLAFKV